MNNVIGCATGRMIRLFCKTELERLQWWDTLKDIREQPERVRPANPVHGVCVDCWGSGLSQFTGDLVKDQCKSCDGNGEVDF